MNITRKTRFNGKNLVAGALIASLLLSFVPEKLASAEPIKPYAEDGYRFGMNENLDKRVKESFKTNRMPYREIWRFDLRRKDESGLTIPGSGSVQSQPIIVNDDEKGIQSIFVQAGSDILKIDYNTFLPQNGTLSVRRRNNITESELPSASAPTYARVPHMAGAEDTGARIYQATRDHRLLSLDAFDLSLYWSNILAAGNHPELRYRITSSPLIRTLENEAILSLGTGSGDLTGKTNEYYADDGFFALSDHGNSAEYLKAIRTEGEVTGSPLEREGIIYNTVNTGNSSSYMYQYGIANNYMGIVDSLSPFNSGVPTSIARDGDFLYVVDRQGTLYKIDARTMVLQGHNAAVVGNSLVLEDPTLSDDYVYVPVKYYKSLNTAGNGAVVVYRKSDLQIEKVIQMDSPLQNQVLYMNDPSYNEPNGYVIVFESNGKIRFYDEKHNWYPVSWFKDENGNLVDTAVVPNTGGQYTSPQLVMYNGMLLAVDGEGIMHAYAAERTHNLFIKEAHIVGKSIEDVRAGEVVQVQATIGNSSNDDFYQVPIKLAVNGKEVTRKEETLLNNTPRRSGDNVMVFDATIPADLPMLSIEVNPDQNNPSDESDWDDNVYRIFSPIDIFIEELKLDQSMLEPESPKFNAHIKVNSKLMQSNKTGLTIHTLLNLNVYGITYPIDVELPVGESKEITVPVDLSNSGIDFEQISSIGMVATINPNYDIYEPLDVRDNNSKSTEIEINHHADLIMTGLTVKKRVTPGERVPVTATITNEYSRPQNNVLVRFQSGTETIYEVRTNFESGESKDVSFNWTAPGYQTVTNIVATVDPDRGAKDNNRDNNVKSALVNVVDTSQPPPGLGQTNGCAQWTVSYPVIIGYGGWTQNPYTIWQNQYATYNECQNASIQINTKQGIPTDRNNPKDSDSESRGSWAIIPYASNNGLDPNKITRAGYGFEVKVTTKYTNDWETKVPKGLSGTARPYGGSYSGATKVTAYFYNTRGEYEAAIDLERTGGNGINDTWELPAQTRRTLLGDSITDRKYYTDVNVPDGNYRVVIIASGGGATGVSKQVEENVAIWGSYYDDSQNIRDR